MGSWELEGIYRVYLWGGVGVKPQWAESVKGWIQRKILRAAIPAPGVQCPLQAFLGNVREICTQ